MLTITSGEHTVHAQRRWARGLFPPRFVPAQRRLSELAMEQAFRFGDIDADVVEVRDHSGSRSQHASVGSEPSANLDWTAGQSFARMQISTLR